MNYSIESRPVGARVGSVIVARAPMYTGLFIRSHRVTVYMYVPGGPESMSRLVKLVLCVFIMI